MIPTDEKLLDKDATLNMVLFWMEADSFLLPTPF